MAWFFKFPFATSGDKAAIPNDAQLDGSVSYDEGFTMDYQLDPETEPTAKDIPRDKFNQLMFAVTQALQQWQIQAFPDFITSADNGGVPYPYAINATVRFEDGWAGSGFKNYFSLEDDNETDPTDNTKWGLVQYAVDELPGVTKEYYGSSLPSGYVWANGTTIGSADSGATGRANADTETLYTLLWNSIANSVLTIQTSLGVDTTRGVSAAADFAANKRLPVPDKRGRVAAGKDDMGGVAAAERITTGVSGISGATLAAFGGSQGVSLTSNQNGQHSHAASVTPGGTHTHKFRWGSQTDPLPNDLVFTGQGGFLPIGLNTNYTVQPGPGNESGGQGPNWQAFSTPILSDNSSHSHSVSNSNSGVGEAHLNVQPTIISNFIIKL